MSSKIVYAFLKAIYVDKNDIGVYYEADVSDSLLIKTGTLIKTLKEWKDFLDANSIIADFSFDEQYLKCNSNVPRYPIASMPTFRDRDTSIITRDNTFYYFLCNGIVNEYILCTDNLIELETNYYSGTEITSFSSIRFSKSTMTMYAMLIGNEGMYNKTIIHLDNVDLVINGFTYGIPVSVENPISIGKYVKNMYINNNEYRLYVVNPEDVQLMYDIYFSENLISLSVVLSQGMRDIVDVLKMYYLNTYEVFVGSSEQKEWCGGSRDWSSKYGVYVDSSLKPLQKYQIENVCEHLYTLENSFTQHHSVNKLLEEVSGMDYALRYRKILKNLVPIVFNDNGSKDDFLTFLHSSLSEFNSVLCIYNLYLYCIRINAYLQKRHVGDVYGQINNPMTQDIILFKEVFWYAG